MINRDFLLGYGAGKSAGGGGGGGSSGFELIYEKTLNVQTTSTAQETIDTIISEGTPSESAYYYYVAFDLAGLRDDHFYGNQGVCFIVKPTGANVYSGSYHIRIRKNGSTLTPSSDSAGYGVYLYTNNKGLLSVCSRYNSSNSKTVDGSFKVKVWKVTAPADIIP